MTTKMNKEQMVKFLDEHFKEVDENLQSRISYTAHAWKKDPKAVTSLDLKDLVKEVMEAVKPVENAEPAVANSVKKTLKTNKKTAEKAEEKQEEEKPVEEEKAPAKKTVGKKTTPAKKSEDVVKKAEGQSKAFDIADSFKEEFEVSLGDTVGTMKKASDIKDMNDLRKALEAGEEVYFAVYWTSRIIRQFGYNSNINSIKAPKSFDNDLDLVSCIFVGEEATVIVGISAYTERPYIFTPEDLKFIEEDGFRYVNNAEYEIYRLTVNE